MAIRNYSNTATQAATSASITAVDTSVTLTGFSGFPTAPFTAALERGTANEEIVLVTAVVGSTCTITRAYNGTTGKSHASSATFMHVVTAIDYTEANAHVNATAAHGTTGAVVGTTDVQTLTNKTLTSPTETSPSVSGGTFTGTQTMATVTISTKLTVPVPSAGTDAVTKTYADALGVSAPTVSTIVRRDAAGRFQAVDPSVAADVATKNYADINRRVGNGTDGLAKVASFTIALADEGQGYNNFGSTGDIVCTIPTHATLAFPVGGWVDLFDHVATASRNITITAAAGVFLGYNGSLVSGGSVTLGTYQYVRLIKVSQSTWYVLNLTGPTDQWHAEYRNSTIQSIPSGANTAVQFPTATATTGMVTPDGTFSTFTVAEAGLYAISAIVRVQGIDGSERYSAIFSPSLGTNLAASASIAGNAGAVTMNPTVPAVRLAAGATIQVVVFQATGAAQNTDPSSGNWCKLYITRIR